jgi:MFS family permease
MIRPPSSGSARAASWDGPVAIAACMSACVAAYGVYLALPLILGALADAYGFSNREIGWIGSAENAGLLLGSVSVSVLAQAGRYRRLVIAGIVIAIAGNAVTLFFSSFAALAAVRLATGFGSGLCYSAAIACLSLTRQSSRNFSVFVVVLVLANSAELWLVPSIVARGGVHGLYAALGLLYVVPALLLRAVPSQVGAGSSPVPSGAAVTPPAAALPTSLAWSCLAAVVLFNVAASAFWAYSERIGTSIGMTEVAVANTLTLCNLFSLTGSLLAYWLSRRWGQHRPQLAAVAVMVAVFATWSAGISTLGYVAGVLVFFEVWSMASVYQLGTLTAIDRSGRYVALVPAAQGIGQSAGPFLAGLLLGWQFAFPQMLMSVTLFAVACIAAYATVYFRLRRIAPAIANA